MSKTDYQGRYRPRVYLAGPLFSEAERTFNLRLTEMLEELTEVYLPQRDGGLMSEMLPLESQLMLPYAVSSVVTWMPFESRIT